MPWLRDLADSVLGRRRAAPGPVSAVKAPPTKADLLAAVDGVEAQVAGKVPPAVSARVARVARVVRDTVPALDNLGGGSPMAYSVVATATSYLPEAVGGYLRLPREYADNRPVDGGKTSLMVLCDSLDLLAAKMDDVQDAVFRSDADALVVHGRFLADKFGTGSLDIGGSP
jgi:hypothetical protein